jgi:ribosomal protection tetracycline resistance protein
LSLRRTLNLGIVAHVDAGKTTLTERLLYAAGVIDEPGSVDAGTTQTDSLALEQQRGITIKSAVVSFAIDDVTVNLIDTPGHPDFIAEVERVLSVLDGAVVVISAVEGVQPQTRILMRALQRLCVPTLLFVNKTDRRGADARRVFEEIAATLTPSIVAAADPAVEKLAEHDDALFAAYVDGIDVPEPRLREALAAQTQRALVYPAFAGSALRGTGVGALMRGIAELLPAAIGDVEAPVSGSVFKIERGAGGEKVAFVRMFSGAVHTRDRLQVGPERDEKVTAISVFEDGTDVRRPAVSAGEIARVWGLRDVRIGDTFGRAPIAVSEFRPPTLESVVLAVNPAEGHALRVALGQLAEQDPLINVRQDDGRGEISVSLYGEVQKEVIQATLADDYGLDVEFRETTPIYVERPVGRGHAVEVLNTESNPFHATIGLQIEPAAEDSGVAFRLQVGHSDVPAYVYKTREHFAEAMDRYVRGALQAGLFGWQVTDCTVTMKESGYSVADGPPSRRGPTSTAADFRKLTPMVVRQALERARTVVCEPTLRLALEVPTRAVGAVLPALARLGAAVETPAPAGELTLITAVLPATCVDDLQRQLPGLTGGEGVLDTSFAGYEPVTGDQPTRRRPGRDGNT